MKALKRAIDVLHKKGYSDAQIARTLQVSRQRWYEWKTGRVRVPAGKLEILARLSGQSAHDLIGRYVLEWSKKTEAKNGDSPHTASTDTDFTYRRRQLQGRYAARVRPVH